MFLYLSVLSSTPSGLDINKTEYLLSPPTHAFSFSTSSSLFYSLQSCSYFNSNAVPLKLSFQNLDPLGDNINVIFKVFTHLLNLLVVLKVWELYLTFKCI